MKDKIGVVGLGIMGSAMARNLLKEGFTVVGYDIRDEAIDEIVALGGERATSPRDVAERAGIVITSLATPAALTAVMSGNDGIKTAKRNGQIIVECSTMSLEIKQRAYDALSAAGMVLLDCPLSGTGAQAARKDLVVFASGDQRAYERCRDVFAGMSRMQKYLGEFGNGSKMKFIANHLVTIHNVAAAEAIVLGIKAGLDAQQVYDVISDSAGSSRMFQVRGQMMVDSDYDNVTATISMQMKDIEIIGAYAAELGCAMPVFAASAQVYFAGHGQGRTKQDTAAVCAVIEDMSGLSRAQRPGQQKRTG
jgi:3-hydroxyisobutyrate dehydrogenase